jgi:hypothetical protein
MKKISFNILAILMFSFVILNSSFNVIEEKSDLTTIILPNGIKTNTDKTPNSIKMYNSIQKYAKIYEIPLYIAYNIAFLETTYEGPFDWGYNQKRTSKCGALGPMQIMPLTAKSLNGKSVPNEKLKNDISLNVELSMKYLSILFKKYEDWYIVCGIYNTGKPIINNYSKFCVENTDYQKNWVSF